MPTPRPGAGRWFHLTAHALGDLRPVGNALLGWWLWRTLRVGFPVVGAACLMLDHLHLLLWTDDPDAARRHLASMLAGFTRHAGERRL
jgi:hypothetical protein